MKVLMEFDYVEVDGLLYPQIEIDGKEVLDELGKYGRMRLEYLWAYKPGMYQEMLWSGRLAEHCKSIDELGFQMAEQIRERYLKKSQVSDEDLVKRIKIYTSAQQFANEIVSSALIYE